MISVCLLNSHRDGLKSSGSENFSYNAGTTTDLVVGASSSFPFILMCISVSSHAHTRTSVKQPAESRMPQPTEPFNSGLSRSHISKKPEMCDGANALIFLNLLLKSANVSIKKRFCDKSNRNTEKISVVAQIEWHA